jgi:hypothetical protein
MNHTPQAEAMRQHPLWKDWMKNWTHVDLDGTYSTYEPDNYCIYEGKDLTKALQSFSMSTYGNEQGDKS